MSYNRQCESVTLSLIINWKFVCNGNEIVHVLYLYYPVITLKYFQIHVVLFIETKYLITLERRENIVKTYSKFLVYASQVHGTPGVYLHDFKSCLMLK